MIGQNSLNNFYQSVKFINPSLAALMSEDVVEVALYALGADKTGGQPAADRLRRLAYDHDLSPVLLSVLGNALTDLGYS